jgi:uracil-DNA glycosylase
MQGRPVLGLPVRSKVLLLGQAPGSKEALLGKPFAWTAGKTLFGWFQRIGLGQDAFRERVYMAAVCRCFPGKAPNGGDRVPSAQEIDNCAGWLEAELRMLRPELIVPVGKLAIGRFMPVERLDGVIGNGYRVNVGGRAVDVVPLPHPSGASVWHRVEPGKTLLARALGLIGAHPAWRALAPGPPQDVSAGVGSVRNQLAPGVARGTPVDQPAQRDQRDGAGARE